MSGSFRKALLFLGLGTSFLLISSHLTRAELFTETRDTVREAVESREGIVSPIEPFTCEDILFATPLSNNSPFTVSMITLAQSFCGAIHVLETSKEKSSLSLEETEAFTAYAMALKSFVDILLVGLRASLFILNNTPVMDKLSKSSTEEHGFLKQSNPMFF